MAELLRVVLVVLVFWVIFRLTPWSPNRPRPRRSASRRPSLPARMIACSHCGLHVPADEAILAGGRAYCCEAHRRADGP